MDGRGPIRVGLVGYGLAGETFHAPFLAATAGLELAAIVTTDPARRHRARAAHPGAVILARASDLWLRSGPAVEVVVVTAPNRAHVPLARAALAAGCSVVVDKPLAPTGAEGRSLATEAEQRGLLLSVFHNRRWDGDFLTVRRLIGEGALGQVWRFESRFERWRPDRQAGSWRERPDPAEAGGVLADLGSHLIDQAVVLFGPPATVYAECGRRRPGAVVDDDTFVALEHPGGVRSHLWASLAAARPGPRFRVLGSEAGYVVWGMDPQEQALRRGKQPGRAGWSSMPEGRWGTVGAAGRVRAVRTEAGNYGRFYAQLAAALRGGGPPPVTAAEAVVTLEVIDAARASAATGHLVTMA